MKVVVLADGTKKVVTQAEFAHLGAAAPAHITAIEAANGTKVIYGRRGT
jgi:hypothetical protein